MTPVLLLDIDGVISGQPDVADFLSERAARHVVDLHNAALGG